MSNEIRDEVVVAIALAASDAIRKKSNELGASLPEVFAGIEHFYRSHKMALLDKFMFGGAIADALEKLKAQEIIDEAEGVLKDEH